MPTLFDSHDEFNEWFSKDIENSAEKGNSRLSEHQLRRLHMILKPFMLRRVKRHVQNELGEKIEEDLFVDLTHRQRNMYRSLLSDQSVRELLRRAKTSHDGPDVETSRYLMNVAMQFRKVKRKYHCDPSLIRLIAFRL
jgi:chromatin-remodeling ATPase INO80